MVLSHTCHILLVQGMVLSHVCVCVWFMVGVSTASQCSIGTALLYTAHHCSTLLTTAPELALPLWPLQSLPLLSLDALSVGALYNALDTVSHTCAQ